MENNKEATILQEEITEKVPDSENLRENLTENLSEKVNDDLDRDELEKEKKKTAFALSRLKKKSIVTAASLLLLVAVLIVGSIAWYTRISGVHGLTLQAANFEFQANFVDEDVILNVADYLNVNHNLAAPGTGGVVPVLLTNGGDTSVKYDISLGFGDTADEFKGKIRFFYFDKSGEKHYLEPGTDNVSLPLEGEIGQASNGQPTQICEFIYWEWVYELNEDCFYYDGHWYDGNTDYSKTTLKKQVSDSKVQSHIDNAFPYNQTIKGSDFFHLVYPGNNNFYVFDGNSGSVILQKNGNYSVSLKTDINKDGNEETLNNKQILAYCYPSSEGFYDKEADKFYFADEVYDIPGKGEMTGREYFYDLHPNNEDNNTFESASYRYDYVDTEIGLGHSNQSAAYHSNGVLTVYEGALDADGTPGKLYAYQFAMQVKLTVTGAQGVPVSKENFQQKYTGMTNVTEYHKYLEDGTSALGTP